VLSKGRDEDIGVDVADVLGAAGHCDLE